MEQPTEPERTISEMLEGKRQRRNALMLAVSLASPSELEGPAQRLKEVMKKSIGGRRQRIPPPAFSR